jgi:hypothetical protein
MMGGSRNEALSRGGLREIAPGDPQILIFPQLKLDRAALKDNLARCARRRIACSISFALLRKCYTVTCPDNVYCGTARRLIVIRE